MASAKPTNTVKRKPLSRYPFAVLDLSDAVVSQHTSIWAAKAKVHRLNTSAPIAWASVGTRYQYTGCGMRNLDHYVTIEQSQKVPP